MSQFGYNNVNELTSIGAGGAALVQGYANKALKSATVNGSAATLPWTQSFYGNATLTSGANSFSASGTDGAGNVKSNDYKINVKGPGSVTPTYDANGNTLTDGTNTYAWDAENRLIQVTYSGVGNNTQLSYDAFGGMVKLVETTSSSVTSTKQFVRCGSQICEERNAGGSLVKQFFGNGQRNSATNYFYTRDHLGSVRDMTDSSGNVQAHYEYGMWGEPTKTSGAQDADFQYAGYYAHARSGLDLTVYRAYNPSLGRWMSRDPIGEDGGVNLYGYAENEPADFSDPLGLTVLTAIPIAVNLVVSNPAAAAAVTTVATGIVNTSGAISTATSIGTVTSSALAGAGITGVQLGSAAAAAIAASMMNAGANAGGRLGNASTRALNQMIAAGMVAAGAMLFAGGGLPERRIPPIGGGKKGASYPDIWLKRYGIDILVNTVTVGANGLPTCDEQRRLNNLQKNAPNALILWFPKW